MRLIACPDCRTQYDVTGREGQTITCGCGTQLEVGAIKAVDAEVRRCASCGALLPEDGDHCDYCRARVERGGELSLLCPGCYARNARDARFCTGCGIEFRPQPLPEELAGAACLACGDPLQAGTVGEVAVQECSRCHGLWVPGRAFDDLVQRAIEAWKGRDPDDLLTAAPRRDGGNPVKSRVEYRRCPQCDAVMNRHNYRRTSGVIIDRCNDHGTWLDADELERIAGFILAGGLDRAKAAEKTTMRTDASEARPEPSATGAAFQRILTENQPVARRGSLFADTLSTLFAAIFRS